MNPTAHKVEGDRRLLPAPVRRRGAGFLLWEENFHPEVRMADLRRFLRLPARRALDGSLAENANWARSWYAAHAWPWMCAMAVKIHPEMRRGLRIDGEWFDSPVLAEKFASPGDGAIAIASAGPEADREAAARLEAGEPDRHYFLECHAAAVAEALLGEICRRLGPGSKGAGRWRQHGPGYSQWSIADTQRLLTCALKAGRLPGPLRALDSGMLQPKKSHLVLFGMESG